MSKQASPFDVKMFALEALGREPKGYADAMCEFIDRKVDGVTPSGFGFEGEKTLAFAKLVRNCPLMSEEARESASRLLDEVRCRAQIDEQRRCAPDVSDIVARLKREAKARSPKRRKPRARKSQEPEAVDLALARVVDSTLCRVERRTVSGATEYRVNYIGF